MTRIAAPTLNGGDVPGTPPANRTPLAPTQVADVLAEQALSATRSQRRNSPTHLVYLGLLMLSICTLLTGLALLSRLSAGREYAAAAQRGEQINALLGTLKALETAAADPKVKIATQKRDDERTIISTQAKAAGMATNIQSPAASQPGAKKGDLRPETFRYVNIREASLEPALKWMQLCLQHIPGLDIRAVEIKPDKNDWLISVTFARWEIDK